MIFPSRNFAILASIAAVSVHAETWRPDLDWASLAAKLSPTASIVDTGFSDYLDQCLPEFRDKEFWTFERSNHALIDQPSGVCVSQLFCAYERCWPRPDGATSTQAQKTADEPEGGMYASYGALSPETQGWLADPQNPSLNLPSKVLFPVVASDVVQAIRFAQENGLEISVKNSGHSLIGASTKKDTLHLNMNRFTEYAATNVVDCGNTDVAAIARLASSSPCDLATARNKPAFIRAGGGENWEAVYLAVEAVNTAQGNKYHAVGGAAGTVSPMGWTFQGGLAGTTGGRMYGLGVDQVLQVEMVLPNGEHVKFGPVEWEDASADGFIVPKTTSVGGVCRSNPEELDESLWEWAECPADLNINFDDLWFAVNGGGGGTWGVVTSIHLQLHDYLTPRLLGLSSLPGFPIDNCDPAVKEILSLFFESFRLRYVLAPSTLNVTQADSDGCGMANAGLNALICYGDAPYQTLVNEWIKFASLVFFDPTTYGISVEDALSCPATLDVSWAEYMKYTEGPYTGQVKDFPFPSLGSIDPTTQVNLLYPKKYIDENFESLMETWPYLGPSFYLAFGTGTEFASDQANSLGSAHRTAGLKMMYPAADFYAQFGEMFDISDKTNFPSVQGSNHIGPSQMGPLKDDWTKACPEEWTMEERDEKCVSIQETIYGTETLARLEAIKEAIDPNYMFDCAGCIGNNRKKGASSAGRMVSFEATLLALLSVGVFLVW